LTGEVDTPASDASTWTFLSTHGQVLLAIARRPDVRMREVADELKITERAVQRIVKDLDEAGYLTRARTGRRNRYEVHIDRPMRHALVAHRQVRDLLVLIGVEPPPSVISLHGSAPDSG
jgi:DNA-binding Lrp family transcriptional regulator